MLRTRNAAGCQGRRGQDYVFWRNGNAVEDVLGLSDTKGTIVPSNAFVLTSRARAIGPATQPTVATPRRTVVINLG